MSYDYDEPFSLHLRDDQIRILIKSMQMNHVILVGILIFCCELGSLAKSVWIFKVVNKFRNTNKKFYRTVD